MAYRGLNIVRKMGAGTMGGESRIATLRTYGDRGPIKQSSWRPHLYVGDAANSGVWKFPADDFSSGTFYEVTPTAAPCKPAVLNGRLYVGTSGGSPPTNGVIEIIDKYTLASNSLYMDTDGVADPEYVTVYDDELYVGQWSTGANNIYRIDPVTGIDLFATTTNNAWGIMFQDDGSFWTTNFTSNIERRSSSGALIGITTISGSTFGGGVYHNGSYYLPNNAEDRIDIINPSTLAVTSFPMTPGTVGEDLAITNGRIYWTERNSAFDFMFSIYSCTLSGEDQVREYATDSFDPVGISADV